MDEWKKDKPYNDITVEELEKLPRVKLDIAKDAFEGPFPCCGRKTEKVKKKKTLKHLSFEYTVWRCPKCKKDYLDSKQARILEKYLKIDKAFDEEITFDRKMNYDGHNFFMRFPKEVTHKWNKNMKAEIIPLMDNDFLVKVR